MDFYRGEVKKRGPCSKNGVKMAFDDVYWDTSKNGVVEGCDSYNKRSTNKSEEFFLKSYFKIVKWKVRVSFQREKN